MVKILHEIWVWSQDRPAWQRDALRRLVLHGELSEDDLHELTQICKATHGLAEQKEFSPLTKQHLPDDHGGTATISLESIFHRRGVNALAEDQTLSFGPSLTVVYGDNAAGKTGYIRVLKSACRARGQEDILGNVTSGRTPLAPVVAIKYRVGSETKVREWGGSDKDEAISRVSVFDTHCAAVYLTEKTDVAFRPFGLDLFDKLVGACKIVRTQLEKEQRSLAANTLATLQARIPDDTAVARLLSRITSLTSPETVRALSHLSSDDESNLARLERSLLDLRANDPKMVIEQLSLRASRVHALAQHLKTVEVALSPESIDRVFAAREEWKRKAKEAETLRETTFQAGHLSGTGSEVWYALWESARRFSQTAVYPDHPFPAVDNGAQCVLCQQDLDNAAQERFRQFDTLVRSTVEKEARQAKETFERLRMEITDLTVTSTATSDALKEIQFGDEEVSNVIATALATAEARRAAVSVALQEDLDLSSEWPTPLSAVADAEMLESQIIARIKTLQSERGGGMLKEVDSDARELRARKLLAQNESTVLAEIERRKKLAAYGLCMEDTKTHGITRKSTSVTRRVVTERLNESFQEELKELLFSHVEVDLKAIGGVEGVLYHKLVLTRAPGVELPRVVSEGEQRCLSIAAFFAELSTAEELSSIVFDDPVSSLDYKWREGVARRLVEKAKKRQVIVFTHDVVFLLLLRQLSGEHGVEHVDQHVRQLSRGAGVCAEELPWVALSVMKRIGHLRKLMQEADKLHRDGHQDAYEREASTIYGLLREAWERALEEVLLDGVVERYRPSVQTRQITSIADITLEDCKAVEQAMTKCSKWLPGHDQAPAARAEHPEPAVLKADIEALNKWISIIRGRR